MANEEDVPGVGEEDQEVRRVEAAVGHLAMEEGDVVVSHDGPKNLEGDLEEEVVADAYREG